MIMINPPKWLTQAGIYSDCARRREAASKDLKGTALYKGVHGMSVGLDYIKEKKDE